MQGRRPVDALLAQHLGGLAGGGAHHIVGQPATFEQMLQREDGGLGLAGPGLPGQPEDLLGVVVLVPGVDRLDGAMLFVGRAIGLHLDRTGIKP